MPTKPNAVGFNFYFIEYTHKAGFRRDKTAILVQSWLANTLPVISNSKVWQNIYVPVRIQVSVFESRLRVGKTEP